MWQALALRASAAVPWKRVVAVALAVPVLLGLTVGAALMSSTLEEEATDVRGRCSVTVNPTGLSVEGLDQKQLQHAATIVEVGRQRGVPEQGIRVALAVAAQESKFRNYANDGTGQLRADQRDVARSLRYPHDAVGRDHGSVNVFQQQYPWWGTLDQLMDPRYAAGKFFDTLVTVPGWEQLPLTVAAQRVQRSAFPNAYARWEPLADEILAGLGPSVRAVQPPDAAASPGPTPSGVGSAAGEVQDPCSTRALPADFAALPGADAGQVAVNTAASWIGTPYSWGGGTIAGPSEGFAQGAGIVGFDCSGLILHAWYQAAGIRLPHSSVAIEAMGTRVDPAQAQAGDVLSFAIGGSRVSHDGLYDGRGGMVHAPRTGKTVEYVPDVLNHPYWSGVLVSITRPPLPGGDGASAAVSSRSAADRPTVEP
jgi:cell wall-associated NlpC family hydrolase